MVLLLAVGLVAVFAGAVAATLVLVTPGPDRTGPGPGPGREGLRDALSSPAPAASGEASSAAPAEEAEEEEIYDEEEERLPEGAAVPLGITRRERDELAAAASTAADGSGGPGRAGRITGSGTIWYGKVYGATPDDDRYYVVASLDSLYFWTSQGDGPWRYEGVFDGGKCGPPVPRALVRAWGTGGFGKRC
ncbi:hypothetical protein [Planomonospora venezuelensis]|uniref:Uncharacterized protein n=1 Tax=Planomonospora venezuelensis TaxID=1999 RepID=A0A841CU00_PLAVE|nr:hypothetical protein [Planomonospora venezuelensis]MBB5960789.1 hypothetical protein [Planomonospora venezuelensis]GIN03818.1 hypothetical protein Pve01_54760 [Planomonospora venezuelensis]